MLKNSDALILIAEIEKSPYKPSDFEHRFLISIGTLLETPQKISPNQEKYLKQIYKRAIGHTSRRR